MTLRPLLFASAALSLGACATTPGVTATPAATPDREPIAASDAAAVERERLYALFADADERELKLNPIGALFRGDMRYADQLGDYLTDEYNEASIADARANLDALALIDRAALNATDRIAYDVFEYNQRQSLEGLSPELLAVTEVRPVNHFTGFHTFYPSFASGQGAARFDTAEDFRNSIARNEDYVAITDRAIGRFREGLDTGVLETRLTIGNVIEQLETQLDMPVEQSPFYAPVAAMPDGIAGAEREALIADYTASIGDIYAVHRRLRDFLRDEYLPNARASVGLSQMKGGEALYARLIENTTTLPLDPDDLHALGLSEVARIRGGMEAVKDRVGFDGTLKQFFDFIRADPQFKRQSREELTQRYYEIGEIVDAKVPEFFSLVPESALEIRPYEEFREKFEAGGSYQSGAPDGSRPGIFYFNAYDLPSRTTPGEVTLYLHEGAPGHHFQISLAQENEALPAFLRFGGNTAYVEGWALYSETLGYEMGLFDLDEAPYARQGTLDDEMLRAMRLVVDTGLHHKGWSRERAIEYMTENSAMGLTDATAEVERYIAIPTQALAYKVGALKIQELRAKAEAALGERFDIRDFHAQVLDTGALPLPVLEAKIDRWIAAGGG